MKWPSVHQLITINARYSSISSTFFVQKGHNNKLFHIIAHSDCLYSAPTSVLTLWTNYLWFSFVLTVAVVRYDGHCVGSLPVVVCGVAGGGGGAAGGGGAHLLRCGHLTLDHTVAEGGGATLEIRSRRNRVRYALSKILRFVFKWWTAEIRESIVNIFTSGSKPK